MKIQKISTQNNYFSQNNFKGYGARPLEYIVMRNQEGRISMYEITKEMIDLGKKYGFKIISEGKEVLEKIKDKQKFIKNENDKSLWTQDVMHFFKSKIFASEKDRIKYKLCNVVKSAPKYIESTDYIQGGNIFFIDNDVVLIGKNEVVENEREYMCCENRDKNFLKQLSYNPKKVIVLPQADFHIDLFVRPLKDNVVLVADDNMTIDILEKSITKIENNKRINNRNKVLTRLKKSIENMKKAINSENFASTESVIKTLEKNGMNVVRIPGRIFEQKVKNVIFPDVDLSNKLNFMNAIVHEDSKGNLVYLTNKSYFVKNLGINKKNAVLVGLNFEDIFKDLVKDYINPNNIHFITGGRKKYSNIHYILEEYMGGIHCLCAEVPKQK